MSTLGVRGQTFDEKGELPPGWMTKIDPDKKRRFYYNRDKDATSWHRPKAYVAAPEEEETASMQIREWLLRMEKGDYTADVVEAFKKAEYEPQTWVDELDALLKEGVIEQFLENCLKKGRIEFVREVRELVVSYIRSAVAGIELPDIAGSKEWGAYEIT